MIRKIFTLSSALLLLLSFTASSVDARDIDEIKQRRKIVIGVKNDYKPFGYVGKDGELTGFDVDIAKYIAKKLGVTPAFWRVTSKDRINRLRSGDVDLIIASMTKTKYRAKIIDFSSTYFVDGQGMLTQSSTTIGSIDDLNGKIIAVIMGSTGEGYVTSSPIDYMALARFKKYTDATNALAKGKVDVIISDFSWCRMQERATKGKLIAYGRTLTSEPFGIGVDKKDKNLKKKVNALLLEMWDDGTFKKIYKKYFGKNPNFNIRDLAGK